MRGRWILGGLIGGGVLFGVLQYNYSLLGEWRYRAMEAHLVDADDESSGSARDLVDREEIENRLDGDVVLFGPQGSGKSFLVQKNNKRSMILDLHKVG
jgi:polynucleotide 5'-kinase involved in rRNA processing